MLQPCKKLTPPDDGKFSTITGKLVETVGDYKVCSEKQEALAKAVKGYQEYLGSNNK